MVDIIILTEGLIETEGPLYHQSLDQLERSVLDDAEETAIACDLLGRRDAYNAPKALIARCDYALACIVIHLSSSRAHIAVAFVRVINQRMDLPTALLHVATDDHRSGVRATAIRYLAENHPMKLRLSNQFLPRLKQMQEGRDVVIQVAATFALQRLREAYPDDVVVESMVLDARTTSGSWRVQDLLNEAHAAQLARNKRDEES